MGCWLVAGLGFGDESKGATVHSLVKKTGADLVVRYNGGAQAAHNVVLADGRHHTFSQFGSGTFVPGTKTYLSKHVLVNPEAMMIEEECLREVGIENAFARTTVDPRAYVITPFHIALNKLQEIKRGDNRHGSTGFGIGITREMSLKYGEAMLQVRDILNPKLTEEKLQYIRNLCLELASELRIDSGHDAISDYQKHSIASISTIIWCLTQYNKWIISGTVIDGPPKSNTGMVFEGAQGMLLDETYGFHPHTTWTDITFANAISVLNEMGYKGPASKIGVLRAYHTRHGAGPFPSENKKLLNNPHFKELHNESGEYAGDFRLGNFDVPLTTYALKCIGGVDFLALSHLDVIRANKKALMRLSFEETINVNPKNFLVVIREMFGIPVGVASYGPTDEDRVYEMR